MNYGEINSVPCVAARAHGQGITQEQSFPIQLTCPYCPAQSNRNPKGLHFILKGRQFPGGLRLAMYVCPQRHRFYVQPEGVSGPACFTDDKV